MKIRTDFVTNSSSSSFVCDICGNEISGWDCSVKDGEMFECVNCHIICNEHVLTPPREKLLELMREVESYYSFIEPLTEEELSEMSNDDIINEILSECCYGEVPEEFCPICQFEEYSSKDMANYLLTKYKISKDEVFEDIKKKNKRRRKLYDFEYINFVTNQLGLNLGDIQSSWKRKYKTYRDFKESIKREF